MKAQIGALDQSSREFWTQHQILGGPTLRDEDRGHPFRAALAVVRFQDTSGKADGPVSVVAMALFAQDGKRSLRFHPGKIRDRDVARVLADAIMGAADHYGFEGGGWEQTVADLRRVAR